MAKVEVLLVGYFKWVGKNICRASSTITLVFDGKEKIIVDTGNLTDDKKILKALKKFKIEPAEITMVVNTHVHPDHRGCNFLFRKAKIITSEDINDDDKFTFAPSGDFSLTPNIKIVRTPGHTLHDCSVLVKTDRGKVAIVGDLFWKGLKDKLAFVDNKKMHRASQKKILKMADFIVPGHGNIFKVKI
jgi:glyoxylase-like metal-dependent hydrolase (beta-lactamase superfamily II)